MKRTADVLTSHHSCTSSTPHVSRSLATLHVLIQPWTTAEHSGPVWPPYQWTRTADQADLAKLGSVQLNLISLHLTLVWQLPIIEHKMDRHGHSWKRQYPVDKPHDDDDLMGKILPIILMERSECPFNTWFLGTIPLNIPNSISFASAILAKYILLPTDRTDQQREDRWIMLQNQLLLLLLLFLSASMNLMSSAIQWQCHQLSAITAATWSVGSWWQYVTTFSVCHKGTCWLLQGPTSFNRITAVLGKKVIVNCPVASSM